MYGSVQLDSLIKAGNDREHRLAYFHKVVDELLEVTDDKPVLHS